MVNSVICLASCVCHMCVCRVLTWFAKSQIKATAECKLGSGSVAKTVFPIYISSRLQRAAVWPLWVCVGAQRGQRSILCVFFYGSPLYSLRWSLSLNLGLAMGYAGCSMSPWGFACLHPAQCWIYRHVPPCQVFLKVPGVQTPSACCTRSQPFPHRAVSLTLLTFCFEKHSKLSYIKIEECEDRGLSTFGEGCHFVWWDVTPFP